MKFWKRQKQRERDIFSVCGMQGEFTAKDMEKFLGGVGAVLELVLKGYVTMCQNLQSYTVKRIFLIFFSYTIEIPIIIVGD